MQPQLQPREHTPRKRYVAPILEQYGAVRTLTETSSGPFYASDGGSYPLSYSSTIP